MTTADQFADKLYEKFAERGVCRTCWRKSAIMKTMDDTSVQHLNEICDIKLSQRTVPYRMCVPCYSKLCRAAQFRKGCHDAGRALLQWVQGQGEGKETGTDSNASFDLHPAFGQMEVLSKSGTLAIECLENFSNSTGEQYLTIYSHRRRKPSKTSSDNDPLSDSKDTVTNYPSDKKLDESNSNYIIVKSEIISIEYQRSDEDYDRQRNELKYPGDCLALKTDNKGASGDTQEPIEVKIEHDDCDDSSNGAVFIAVSEPKARKAGRKALRKGKGAKKEGGKSKTLGSEIIDGVDEKESKVKKKKRRTKLEMAASRAKVKPSRVVYYAFDPTKATIIKLSPEEQRAELEQIRLSEKFLGAPYRCQACAKHYVTETGWQQHMDKHKEGGLACTLCGLGYSTARALRMHGLTHSERYACARCPSVFCSRAAVVKHSASHDGAGLTFACSVCGKISKCMNSHKMHEKLHANLRPYKCDRCPRDFTQSTARNLHVMRAHTNVRPFRCPACPSAFVTSTALQAHSLKHSAHQAHYCVECDVRFKSAASLTTHLTTSSRHALPSALRFPCDECDARYPTRPRLLEHVQSAHVRSASHACPACPKAFHTASALRHHRTGSHAEGERLRRHKCEHCDKAFTTRTILKHHRMIHTGERPYSCATCAKTFRHTAALWTHNKLVHKQGRAAVQLPEGGDK